MAGQRTRKSKSGPKKLVAAPIAHPISQKSDPPILATSPTAISAYHEEVLRQNEQLREAHFELEVSRDRYAQLYDDAPVGFMTLDRNGVIEKANLTALTLIGDPRAMVVNRPLLVFVHEDDRGLFLNFLLRCRNGLERHKQWVEVRLRCTGGRYAHVQLSAVGASRELGSGMVYLTALTDITGRMQLEEQRRKAEERVAQAMRERVAAQAANEAKDHFLAMLSHELRTPLTPALLGLSVMAEDETLSQKHRDEIKMVLNNLHLEVQLIDDLLDLNRILRGKFVSRTQHIDLRDVIRASIQICNGDHSHQLILLPNLYSTPLPVHGDRVRLQQVFWNILRNAMKFTPSGGQITLQAGRTRDAVIVRITDTGIGIEPNALTRIFDAFRQGSPGITRQFGGLGLGLAISKAILEAHQGNITASSEGKDRGTTFTVTIPLDLAREKALLAPQPPARHAAAQQKKNLRILLVEDHDDTRTAIARLLKTLGFKVDSSANAAQAIAAASRKKFDLVISDIGLPDRDGYELMRELRAQHHLKGIALSGYGMPLDQARSKQAGFEMHIVKPVSMEMLKEAIQDIASS
jgi:PAS domain S-box-containing protein